MSHATLPQHPEFHIAVDFFLRVLCLELIFLIFPEQLLIVSQNAPKRLKVRIYRHRKANISSNIKIGMLGTVKTSLFVNDNCA